MKYWFPTVPSLVWSILFLVVMFLLNYLSVKGYGESEYWFAMIKIKIGRVGGLTEAKKIHDLCELHHIPVWCGGMLEAGIGRAHNIAITTLPNFTLPGDTAASSNYWEKDIIDPEVTVKKWSHYGP